MCYDDVVGSTGMNVESWQERLLILRQLELPSLETANAPPVDALLIRSAPNDSNARALLRAIDDFPIDRSSILQERLDLVDRQRTSVFPWRGQFSPEFGELMLAKYASKEDVVADPFVGSGTTLFEAARKSLACFGAEINPAAVLMAITVQFANLAMPDRRSYVDAALNVIEKHLPIHFDSGLFTLLAPPGEGPRPSLQQSLQAMLQEASTEPLIYNVVANTITRFMTFREEEKESGGVFRAFKAHQALVEGLPHSKHPCTVIHCDARTLPLIEGTVNLVVTSPPYINVFNYHQNCREAMELVGWDMLRVARSEFGSNRKNRGNRFLTVVQYCIDMLLALLEMRRIARSDGRIVIVIGRESRVRGVSFQNGRIVTALALGAAGLRLILRQERKFKNKFGEVIYEDILHFSPMPGPLEPAAEAHYFARLVAQHLLYDSANLTNEDVRRDVVEAIRHATVVPPSPIFIARKETSRRSCPQPLT